jgi:histidinol dehydrogenase
MKQLLRKALDYLLGVQRSEPQDERANWTSEDWEADRQQAAAWTEHEDRMQQNMTDRGLELMEAEGIAKHANAIQGARQQEDAAQPTQAKLPDMEMER